MSSSVGAGSESWGALLDANCNCRIDLRCREDTAGIDTPSAVVSVLLMHTSLLGGVAQSLGDPSVSGSLAVPLPKNK